MIIWGGYNDNGDYVNTGGKYNPSTDNWVATSTTNVPSKRYLHTAVWTGSEMIVWGGHNDTGQLNTGGRYDPSTDNWVATSTTNAPSQRFLHTAVWTGSEMIVWGGQNRGPRSAKYWRQIRSQHGQLGSDQHHQRAIPTIASHGSLDRQRNDRLGGLSCNEHRRRIQSQHE